MIEGDIGLLLVGCKLGYSDQKSIMRYVPLAGAMLLAAVEAGTKIGA